ETLYMGGVVTPSTLQIQSLGVYTIHGDYHNSRPVYIHESGKYYLYYQINGFWAVNNIIGSFNVIIKIHSSSLLPQDTTGPVYAAGGLMDNITISSYTNT
ncbi:unnamed protein product, partial [Owenia fusiformis]